MTGNLADLITEINDLRAQYTRDNNYLKPLYTAEKLATAFSVLFDALELRVFPIDHSDDSNDRLEQVVISVHGVDVSIRGRYGDPGTGDLYVNIADERNADNRAAYPLAVEVNETGENYYGEPNLTQEGA